jgi:alpha-ribazole phosphatase
MIIYLIRHGKSIANQEHRLAGQTDVPLCHEGIEQLQHLRSINYYPSVKRVYSSDLERAIRTAVMLFDIKEEDLNLRMALREISFGTEENVVYQPHETKAYFHKFMNNTISNGGETYNEFMLRISKAWSDIINDYSGLVSLLDQNYSIAIVAHYGTLRAVLILLGIIEPEAMFRDFIPNGLGYKLHWGSLGLQGYSKLTALNRSQQK